MEKYYPVFECRLVKSHSSTISEENTLAFKLFLIHYYLKLPSKNFMQRLEIIVEYI